MPFKSNSNLPDLAKVWLENILAAGALQVPLANPNPSSYIGLLNFFLYYLRGICEGTDDPNVLSSTGIQSVRSEDWVHPSKLEVRVLQTTSFLVIIARITCLEWLICIHDRMAAQRRQRGHWLEPTCTEACTGGLNTLHRNYKVVIKRFVAVTY